MANHSSIQLPNVKKLFSNLLKNNESVQSFDQVTSILFAASRNIWIGDLAPETGDDTEAAIRFWNLMDDYDRIPVGQRKPIILNITSNGGDLDAAFTIIDAINMSCTPVYTVNTGCAYSGGALIAMAGHKRFCYPHATYLLHEGSVEGAGGDAHKFRNFNDFYESRVEQIKEHVLRCTKIDEEDYEKRRRDDWWFLAEDALEVGLVDAVMTSFPNFDGCFMVDREAYKDEDREYEGI